MDFSCRPSTDPKHLTLIETSLQHVQRPSLYNGQDCSPRPCADPYTLLLLKLFLQFNGRSANFSLPKVAMLPGSRSDDVMYFTHKGPIKRSQHFVESGCWGRLTPPLSQHLLNISFVLEMLKPFDTSWCQHASTNVERCWGPVYREKSCPW